MRLSPTGHSGIIAVILALLSATDAVAQRSAPLPTVDTIRGVVSTLSQQRIDGAIVRLAFSANVVTRNGGEFIFALATPVPIAKRMDISVTQPGKRWVLLSPFEQQINVPPTTEPVRLFIWEEGKPFAATDTGSVLQVLAEARRLRPGNELGVIAAIAEIAGLSGWEVYATVAAFDPAVVSNAWLASIGAERSELAATVYRVKAAAWTPYEAEVAALRSGLQYRQARLAARNAQVVQLDSLWSLESQRAGVANARAQLLRYDELAATRPTPTGPPPLQPEARPEGR